MTFASHIFSGSRAARGWLCGGLLLALALAAALVRVTFRAGGERLSPAVLTRNARAWHEAPVAVSPDFSVLRGPAISRGATAADFLAAFRFAGSFFVEGGDSETLRRGVLSYLPESRQQIVSEGSLLAGVRVKHIAEDHIVLEKDGVEGMLTLGGSDNAMMRSYLDQVPSGEIADAARKSRFGEQTGEGVWTLRKEAIQAYYDELLDEPERLLQVFDSMAPLYGEDGQSIEGYQLQAVGEQAFFDAVGFLDGDVVRKVNALPMTNRGRAEFFIHQVVQDRVSAIVIDIEREGGPKRLVYQLR